MLLVPMGNNNLGVPYGKSEVFMVIYKSELTNPKTFFLFQWKNLFLEIKKNSLPSVFLGISLKIKITNPDPSEFLRLHSLIEREKKQGSHNGSVMFLCNKHLQMPAATATIKYTKYGIGVWKNNWRNYILFLTAEQ